MYLLAKLENNFEGVVSPSGERFVFLWNVIIRVTIYLGKSFTKSICYIFPACMESNVLEKSANNNVASRFFTRTLSMIWKLKSCDSISPKTVLIFP